MCFNIRAKFEYIALRPIAQYRWDDDDDNDNDDNDDDDDDITSIGDGNKDVLDI